MIGTTANRLFSRHALRYSAYRILSIIRPKPQKIPLSISQVLESQQASDLVNRFNDLCYSGGIFKLNWRGIEVLKNPCDLWMTLELMQSLRPTAILETGTHFGGSACFYADMAAVLGVDCEVITIDVNPKISFNPIDKKIHSIVGISTANSTAKQAIAAVQSRLAKKPGHVLVFLDSNHSKENVLAELRLYSDLVTIGSYCIVEDTNVNGHPSFPSHGPGPWEAVQEFLSETDKFKIDLECQRFLLTFNPQGWLRRAK